MRVSKTWNQFKQMLDVAHPKPGDTLLLPLMAEWEAPSLPKPEPKPRQMSMFEPSPTNDEAAN
jgi:hypothetical protein